MSFVLAAEPGTGSHWSAVAELSPNDYAADLNKLATEVLGNQLRALIALRQPDLRILSDPTGLGRVALTAQARNAKAARHFLSTIQPKMALLISEATSLGNLMLDLNQTLAATSDPQQAGQALARVLDRMRDHECCARDGLAMARTNADITDNTAKMLEKAIDKVIAEAGGRDGRAARAKAAVERTEKTISAAIQTLLGGSDITGQGIRDIATQSVSLFGSTRSARQRDSGAIADFLVEAITTITPDAAEPEPGTQTIPGANALLQGQYRMLATFGVMLAATQVIRNQTVELSEAAGRLARIAGETDATLATVIASVEALRVRLTKGDAVAVIAAELDAAMFAWTRLTIRTREIERTLSGINLLFPEA